MEKYIQIVKDWFKKLTAEQKRNFALLCTGLFVLILTISVLVSIGSNSGEAALKPESSGIFLQIPAEELFLPDEPDYIPGVLLERDRRSSWTFEDAEEYWEDPLRSGEEQWREKIEKAIDDFLERVP